MIVDLAHVFAWPATVLALACMALGCAYRWRHPFMAGERLDRLELRAADMSVRLAQLDPERLAALETKVAALSIGRFGERPARTGSA